jgi:hypothetical protein
LPTIHPSAASEFIQSDPAEAQSGCLLGSGSSVRTQRSQSAKLDSHTMLLPIPCKHQKITACSISVGEASA